MRLEAAPATVTLRGTPAAPGLAAGRLVRLAAPARRPRRPGTPAEERASFGSALEHDRATLAGLIEAAAG